MGSIETGSFVPEFPEEDAITSAQYDALRNQVTTVRNKGVSDVAASSKGDLPDPNEFARAVIGENWMTAAACKGITNVFFIPQKKELKDERELREARAKAICRQCRVIENCLEYALANNEKDGIWGGLTEEERRKMQGRGRRRSA